MGIVLTNAILVDIDPIRVETGSLRIEGNKINVRGSAKPQAEDTVIDCGGAVVLPGLVNGHTHLYSALAVGMPAPPRNPTNFLQILQLVWWRLDQALDDRSNEMSATIGALDALHCGTTTLIDHHASPRAIAGSLDSIERGITSVGLRGVLCYEVTDRHGKSGRDAGLAENERYLRRKPDGRFAGLVGAHAAFTLADDALTALADLAKRYDTAVHIHVAEDTGDDAVCRRDFGAPLLDRLQKSGLFDRRNIFAHGIHLNAEAIEIANHTGLHLAHNARSNMNNAVGYSPIGKLKCPIQLGTDGIGADMFAESKAAWFKSRDGHAGIAPADIIQMLANSARCASDALKVKLGVLEVGAAADVVITDYVPFSPLTTDNLPGHFIFAMSSRNIRHVIADGKLVLRDRVATTCDEPAIRAASRTVAADLWKRMERIPV